MIDVIIDLKQYSKMEFMGTFARAISTKFELSYNELNNHINKLIQDLGERIKKQIVVNEQKKLLEYKENVIDAQRHYKQLKQKRNDQIIKENVFNKKAEKEKIFNQYSLKSEDMNNLYTKLKQELQKGIQYSNQIQTQIKFIGKQCKIALSKSEVLDQQIKQLQRKTTSNQDHSKPPLLCTKSKTQQKSITTQLFHENNENRLKMKIDFLRQYLNELKYQENTLQKIFNQYDYQSCKSQPQKYKLVESIFNNQELKRYLYKIIFENKQQKIIIQNKKVGKRHMKR